MSALCIFLYFIFYTYSSNQTTTNEIISTLFPILKSKYPDDKLLRRFLNRIGYLTTVLQTSLPVYQQYLGSLSTPPPSATLVRTLTIDVRVLYCILLGLSVYTDDPIPNSVRSTADSVAPTLITNNNNNNASSSSATSTTDSNTTSSSSQQQQQRRDDRRAHFLTGIFSKVMQSIHKTVSVDPFPLLQYLSLYCSNHPTVVNNVHKRSVVIGDTTKLINVFNGLTIEDCVDATIFVVASVPFILCRRCVRCTIVTVPVRELWNIEDCTQCSISTAVPYMSIRNTSMLQLFTWTQYPIEIHGDIRDIVIGPYNVVSYHLLTKTTLQNWQKQGGYVTNMDSNNTDSSTETSSSIVRKSKPEEFYWRYLPLCQTDANLVHSEIEFQKMEKLDSAVQEANLALTKNTTSGNGPSINQIAKEASALDCGSAKTAEMLTQASFVTWLLEDSKALSLKNSLR